jgi:hypothetical protein
MRRLTLLASVVGFVVPLLTAVSAHAQATRTWVSGVGDDANPCSRTAPCKTFAGAISKTATNGEINCLDPGGFGGVTITKAITISCEAGTAGVLVSGTNAIIVNAPTTANVYLKGLDIEGLNTGINGINFLAGAGLVVENCVIRGFGATNGLGIKFTPSNNATMNVVNTIVHHNGNSASGTGGGIQVAPSGVATVAKAMLDRVTVDRNIVGVAAIGVGAASEMMIINSTIANNTSIGAVASGTGATIRIGSSVIANNAGASVSGNVLSFLNNQINSNNPDTAPATAGGLK